MKRISAFLFSVLTVGFVVVFVTGFAHHAQAAERLVPQDYGTVQSAINAAVSGDIITVDPGTYRENVSFLGKAITVRSKDPNDPDIVAATIIDGGRAGSVITFAEGEGNGSLLSGVTVQNGQALPPPSKAAGFTARPPAGDQKVQDQGKFRPSWWRNLLPSSPRPL